MSVSKDPSGNWMSSTRYKEFTGEVRQKLKRGFKTKKEALEWERKFLQKQTSNLTMTFESFVEIYTADVKPRIKQNTWQTKVSNGSGEIHTAMWQTILKKQLQVTQEYFNKNI